MNRFVKENLDALSRRFSAWRRWRSDKRGLAAIEFAMIFPVAVGLYMGAAETSQVLTLNRKVTNITSAMSDLVAQQDSIDDATMAEIFSAAASMIVPFDEGPVKIAVSSVVADPDDGSISVDWSDGYHRDARTPGSTIEIPEGLITNGESVIYTEVSYQYDSVIGHFITDGFTLEDEFYTKPRRTLQITRE